MKLVELDVGRKMRGTLVCDLAYINIPIYLIIEVEAEQSSDEIAQGIVEILKQDTPPFINKYHYGDRVEYNSIVENDLIILVVSVLFPMHYFQKDDKYYSSTKGLYCVKALGNNQLKIELIDYCEISLSSHGVEKRWDLDEGFAVISLTDGVLIYDEKDLFGVFRWSINLNNDDSLREYVREFRKKWSSTK